MVLHLDTYLKSTRYKDQCQKALQLQELTSIYNRVCTCVCFSLLRKIVHNMKSQNEGTEDVPQPQELNDIELNVLRYVSGACIHHISKHMKLSVKRKLLGNLHHAKVYYRAQRFLNSLHQPEGCIIQNSDEPETLLEIIR